MTGPAEGSGDVPTDTATALPKPLHPAEAWLQRWTRRWFSPDPERTRDRAAVRLKAHAEAHGGPATAVISALGNRGYRIVAVAADGAFGDAILPTRELAEAACEAAGFPVGEWDREATALITPTPADRLRMAGRRR